jgi:hypothetical protein
MWLTKRQEDNPGKQMTILLTKLLSYPYAVYYNEHNLSAWSTEIVNIITESTKEVQKFDYGWYLIQILDGSKKAQKFDYGYFFTWIKPFTHTRLRLLLDWVWNDMIAVDDPELLDEKSAKIGVTKLEVLFKSFEMSLNTEFQTKKEILNRQEVMDILTESLNKAKKL